MAQQRRRRFHQQLQSREERRALACMLQPTLLLALASPKHPPEK